MRFEPKLTNKINNNDNIIANINKKKENKT